MTHDFPSSIAIAGAWGYIGRKFLDAARQLGIDVFVHDPGPVPDDLDLNGVARIAEEAEFYDTQADLFHLALHPDKTRLIPFRRPPNDQRGKGPGPFDFLGFTLYWRRTRGGRWQMAYKTRADRLARFIRSVHDWCRRHRHQSVKTQHAALTRRIRGHFNYFGVNGNAHALGVVYQHAQRSWFKWLVRRSQRSRLTWDRFEDLLRDFPLPAPRICVQIWGRAP